MSGARRRSSPSSNSSRCRTRTRTSWRAWGSERAAFVRSAMEQSTHLPVLLREVVAALGCRPGGKWVDGTVGAGGHAEAILRATAPDGRLVGCDRDPGALAAARRRLEPFAPRVDLHVADHRSLPALLDGLGDAVPVDGILLDLGVSSMQLDDAERGFSFRLDGPLDMRMDRG